MRCSVPLLESLHCHVRACILVPSGHLDAVHIIVTYTQIEECSVPGTNYSMKVYIYPLCCAGLLEDNLVIGDFHPGEHSLDITVNDVYGQSVTHPTLTFTRPDLLEVECSVHDEHTIDCTNSTVVESQICSIDDGSQFDCSLPRDIVELASTFNLTVGEHNLTIMTLDEFAQADITVATFTVFRKLLK